MKEPRNKTEFNLDLVLSEQSRQLFQLDNESRQILSTIAKKGPRTVYRLGKETKITRQTIYRRLNGEEGLLEQKFLKVVKVEDFEPIKRLTKKFFGLTLKGLFAALRDVRLENIYLIENFLKIISERYRSLADVFKIKIDEEIVSVADLVGLYIKAEIALWFQCHLENGLNLTSVKDFRGYYFSTRNVSEVFTVKGWTRYDEKGNMIVTSGYSDTRKKLMAIKTSYIEALLKIRTENLDVPGDVSYWTFILESIYSEWGRKNVDRVFNAIPPTTLELYPTIPSDITIKGDKKAHIIVGPSTRYVHLKAQKTRRPARKNS